MDTITITETGCYLDNHRGHYIVRDTIELAVAYGFIIGGFAQFAVDAYEDDNHRDGYPMEELIELCDEAVDWLNSGQDKCENCCEGSFSPDWPGPGYEWQQSTFESGRVVAPGAWVICRACSGTGRGPRMAGQNFPPIIPEGTIWTFNDGDFGLYEEGDLD